MHLIVIENSSVEILLLSVNIDHEEKTFILGHTPKECKLKENELGWVFTAYMDKYKEDLQIGKKTVQYKKEKAKGHWRREKRSSEDCF